MRLAKEEGRSTLENGRLLEAAEDSGFEVMLTADKNLSYQQNLQGRRLALIILSTNNWMVIEGKIELIVAAVLATKPGSFQLLDLASLPDGRTVRRAVTS